MADLLSSKLPIAPRPTVQVHGFAEAELEAESQRLAARINDPERWGLEMCRMIAPLTLRINRLKEEQGVFLMAHSYQTPDIVYGVADAVGDSYGLAKKAAQSDADTILFSSVRFMAETAKIVNPTKRVLHPSPEAGCSLADGITAADVRNLKEQHPGVPVVCYINTTADVKAECDVSVTSSNYLDICRNLPGDEIVFVPDQFMGAHLQKAIPEKTFHVWAGSCEVHDQFTADAAKAWREVAKEQGRELHILAHPECTGEVLLEADFVGSSEKMMDYARQLEAQGKVDVMPVTECGTADRMRAEIKGLNIMGACVLCPHMKKTGLGDILQCLEAPRDDQVIQIDASVLAGAQANLDAMFRLAEA
ncbi:MAG: quinolinate synthase [Thermoplasmatota archaeon]